MRGITEGHRRMVLGRSEGVIRGSGRGRTGGGPCLPLPHPYSETIVLMENIRE